MPKRDEKKIVKYQPSKFSIAAASYKNDYYKWSFDQSRFLQKKEFDKLDIPHLIEEIESLGNSERRALESHLKVLMIHLLKIQYQPDFRTRSWDNSVKVARFQINKLLKRNPSLKRELPEITKDAYYVARLDAANETTLSEKTFPAKCPWTVEECLKRPGL